jgi:phage-related protein
MSSAGFLGQIRLLYFFYSGEKIVITHGLVKKDKKVRDAEIERAIQFREDYHLRRKDRTK